MNRAAIEERMSPETFLHEALFYAGEADFVAWTSLFVRSGLERDESIFVVVGERKIELLRDELGGAADRVRFADMGDVGRNPARIIPTWRAFLDSLQPGARARGIGEPIWSERTADEVVECERHEALLNLAFAGDAHPWWLLCPYDTDALAPSVVEDAQRNHPIVLDHGNRRDTATFRGIGSIGELLDGALPEPDVLPVGRDFDATDLVAMRRFVGHHARGFGLTPSRTEDLVLAGGELVSNSLRHGGGSGTLRMWRTQRAIVCEVADRGRFRDPLAGRRQPVGDRSSGFGLWLVNQLCDLVQVRSSSDGSTVRLHVLLD